MYICYIHDDKTKYVLNLSTHTQDTFLVDLNSKLPEGSILVFRTRPDRNICHTKRLTSICPVFVQIVFCQSNA